MAPLILHNVPDEECYIGEDGVKRPYAMYFNTQDGGVTGSTRSRRSVAETGSFGKSTRRSRSRTGTPAARAARENPTLAAADKLFGDWVSSKQAAAAAANNADDDEFDDATTPAAEGGNTNGGSSGNSSKKQKEAKLHNNHHPVEVMLRGYRDADSQYAAISRYETLAGMILEDYPRQPPASLRRFQSTLREPATVRKRPLTAEEKQYVSRADGGEHWVKVTFESLHTAEAAVYSSPQRVLGYWVHAEFWKGNPPARDEALPDVDEDRAWGTPRARPSGSFQVSSFPTSFHSRLNDLQNGSPSQSQVSSQTIETGTLSSATATDAAGALATTSSADLTSSTTNNKEDDGYCRKIPTARRVVLMPAEQALRPQQSFVQRFLAAIPILAWFGGSIIGNEVPRTDTGEFDWKQASLYWKIIWWLDATFGLFQGDIYGTEKED